MTPVAFGLFDWIDRGTAPLQQLYEERLQLLEAADAAGFFAYHLAEHHATPLGMAPSPALFLTAAAQRTRRIRLGPLVYLLPLYNPLRLIEEVCMLDHLSGGRLELGVGRGVSPYELGYFGVDAAGTRAIFDEALAVLLAGLTHERLTFEGQHYRYHDVPMELRPLQQPYPPLWYPTHNPESVGLCGQARLQFRGPGPGGARAPARGPVLADLGGAPARAGPAQRPCGRAQGGHRPPGGRGGHRRRRRGGDARGPQGLVSLDHEAVARPRRPHHDGLFAWETSTQRETILFGSPARVREQMARLLEVSGCNYVLWRVRLGHLAPRAGAALAAPVRGGGDAGLRVSATRGRGAEGGRDFCRINRSNPYRRFADTSPCRCLEYPRIVSTDLNGLMCKM